MNRRELRRLMASEDVRDDTFDLEGGNLNEVLSLRPTAGGWLVYFIERGEESFERLFDTEDEACDFMAVELLKDPSTRRDWGQRGG